MPANYLHGVESIQLSNGLAPISVVKSAVIGLVGTAPVHAVDEEFKTVNKPVLITNTTDAAKYFGVPTAGYTIPQALKAIYEQGNVIVIVVNAFDPAVHKTGENPDPTLVLAGDIIGEVDNAGQRSGLQVFDNCYSEFGFVPKILISPVFSTQKAVSSQLELKAEKYRGICIADAPIGTTVQGAITSRGGTTDNFATSSYASLLCYPHLKVWDNELNAERLEPYSQRLAGLIAAIDMDKGFHYSASNNQIKGVIGMERPITAGINDPTSEANLLNEKGIITVFNSYGTGIRSWGNRSAAFWVNTDIFTFYTCQRTKGIIMDSVDYAMQQKIDGPIDYQIMDEISEMVNEFLRSLASPKRKAIADGKCYYTKADNTPNKLISGNIIFKVDYMPIPLAERITFNYTPDKTMLEKLLGGAK